MRLRHFRIVLLPLSLVLCAKEEILRLFLFLTLFAICCSVKGDDFLPVPELSKSCSLEVANYDAKVKSDVQDYVHRIYLDNTQALMSIRRLTISEGALTIQEKTDARLFENLLIILNDSEISDRDLGIIKAVRDYLKTYPLAISESDSEVLENKFIALGI